MKKSREFFTASGAPEDKKVTQARRVKHDAFFIKALSSHFKKDPEFKQILREVDFNLLRKIFERFSRKSGLDPKGMNFIKPNRIVPYQLDRDLRSGYSSEANIIFLPYTKQKEEAGRLKLDPRLFCLFELCHEEAHATSGIACFGLEKEPSGPDHKIEHRMGYGRIFQKKTRPGPLRTTRLFQYFNEGVTEKIAKEVFNEYVLASGFATKQELDKFWSAYQGACQQWQMPAETYIKLVEAFIFEVSRVAGLGEETVWRAIVRGQREGEDLKNQELQKFFDEIFGRGFINKLARADDAGITDIIRTASGRNQLTN